MTTNKKTVLGLLLAASMGALSWQKAATPEGFTLIGNVPDFKDSIVFLTYGTFDNTKIDSAKVTDGKFAFKGEVAEPLQGMLFSRNYRLRLDLFVDKGNVTVEGPIEDMKVVGSPVVNEYEVFNRTIMSNRKWVNKIFTEAYEAKQAGDTTRAKGLEADGNKWYAYEYEIRKTYIKSHPASPISARELLMYVNNKTLAECTPMYAALEPQVKATLQGQELTKRFELLNKITTGKAALPFSQAAVDGKKITLGTYKGKYVLLEFWASWCGPCRAENPNLRKQVDIFGSKGFNVLGVSLDKARDPWVKAIEKDGLTWTQVSDLKGWNNEIAVAYGVKAVPANFLIDPSGTIIAQDLRGEALNQKLKEIFK
ncbi:TlpA disulfide reductase family protein [Paraflavitalea sp. CAU 1676]|uniref:TlpA disulfide reductase family protein n=1 Tax=Paraflavitalea sp. CAU 1676 TaxID=3032598 RepID=UPI0023DA5EDE|nr:TlpA disulfide reductase family protein [Paraflavitalea sp. CAU 1676]MDF2188888.1 TlpA disulfide reductase family protein [Paraflavitalea sp. CAU 1676]